MDGVIYGASPSPAPTIQPLAKPAQAIHKQSRQSFTLMRQAVSKPKQFPSIKSDIKRVTKISKSIGAIRAYSAKPAPDRLQRAQETSRHSKINRFGQSLAPFHKSVTTPVKPMVNRISAKVTHRVEQTRQNTKTSALSGASSAAMARPLPTLAGNAISHQKLEAMLDKALTQADAHKQILRSQLRGGVWHRLNRFQKIIMLVLALVGLTGAITYAYLKVPAFSVRVASIRANVPAQTPAYTPAGFSLAQTSYQKGAVALKFKSATGDYTVGQQTTGLNSESLKATYIAPKTKLYQTSQYNGVTIYTYDTKSPATTSAASETNAVWVNNGVMGTITNNAGLTADQLAKIAQSVN